MNDHQKLPGTSNEIRALLFDFDGLILDTETPKFEAWSEIYQEQGAYLALEEWAQCLGTSDRAFDPVEHLQNLTGKIFDRKVIHAEFLARTEDKVARLDPFPGAVALIDYARLIGLTLGIASSSPRSWVVDHLERLNLAASFECILCKEDAPRVKPDPDLYLLLMQWLRVSPANSVAFEDSPNGITAARAAGIFCVGVPNALSRFLDISHADMILSSLAAMQPAALLAEIQRNRGQKA